MIFVMMASSFLPVEAGRFREFLSSTNKFFEPGQKFMRRSIASKSSFSGFDSKRKNRCLAFLGLMSIVPLSLAKAVLPPLPIRSRLQKLAISQWKNPLMKLNAEDRAFLEAKGRLNAYEARRAFFLKFGWWHNVLKFVHGTSTLAIRTGQVAWLWFMISIATSSSVLSAEEYLKETENKTDSVYVIVDRYPFPHVSLQINGTVYWFSVNQIVKIHSRAYFTTSPEDIVGGHSSVIVPIKLSKDEVTNLRAGFEQNVGKFWINTRLTNTCSTMACRELDKHTSLKIDSLFDESPQKVLEYLALLKMMGDLRIGEFYYIDNDESGVTLLRAARDIGVSYAESQFFNWANFTATGLSTVTVPLKIEHELLAHRLNWEDKMARPAAQLAEFEEWRRESEQYWADHQYLALYERKLKEFHESGADENSAAYQSLKQTRAAVLTLVTQERAALQRKAHSKEIDFPEIMKARFALEALEARLSGFARLFWVNDANGTFQ